MTQVQIPNTIKTGMKEQHFIDPCLISEQRRKELDPIVTEIAYKLDGLYGYEIEHIINILRSH